MPLLEKNNFHKSFLTNSRLRVLLKITGEKASKVDTFSTENALFELNYYVLFEDEWHTDSTRKCTIFHEETPKFHLIFYVLAAAQNKS